MKSILYLFLILIFGLFSTTNTFAQGGEKRKSMSNGGPYWVFGLNGGGAWQDSDVKARAGGGWSGYIGHSFYNKPNGFFSADARFRYLNTVTYGQNELDTEFGNTVLADPSNFNYRPDTAKFAHNHQTFFHDLSLELRVNFEQLRRVSRVWFSVYAGMGMGIYASKFDQLDADENEYDYKSIDYNQADRDVIRDIIAMRDGTFETFAAYDDDRRDNLFRLTATPTIGAELGYWFSPSFGLGIGHRTTFTLQDDFEGIEINNGGAINSSIHHYTSLMLHWRFTPRRYRITCPDVRFQLPVSSGNYSTDKSTVFVKAYINSVSESQITYTVNGQSSSDFTYNDRDDVFQSNIKLNVGSNTITIKATNSCGTDAQTITINYKPRVKQAPVVNITNSPTTATDDCKINITAQILYVTAKNNVTFTVNGRTNHNFSFSGSTFQANNVSLQSGKNTIIIKGINQDGSDSKTIIINCTKKLYPVVNITNPGSNPHRVNTASVNIAAQILNVVGKNNVTFTVNGQNSSNFSFTGTSFNANNISLYLGNNTITITGRNENGQDSKTITVIYEKPTPQPPIVTITNPSQNPFNTNVATANIKATILHVQGKNNVTYVINGQNSSNFLFSGTDFAGTVNLNVGSNTITITGTNEYGQDSKTIIINYQPPTVVEQPPLVTITNPSVDPYTTQVANHTVMATILNVDSRNDVTCTVNGQGNNSFSFAETSFTLPLNLVPGNNTVTITGRNNAGQDTKSTLIIYNEIVQIPPPEVVITYPSTNPYATQVNTVNINATITNVDTRNNVTFTVNGQNNNNSH